MKRIKADRATFLEAVELVSRAVEIDNIYLRGAREVYLLIKEKNKEAGKLLDDYLISQAKVKEFNEENNNLNLDDFNFGELTPDKEASHKAVRENLNIALKALNKFLEDKAKERWDKEKAKTDYLFKKEPVSNKDVIDLEIEEKALDYGEIFKIDITDFYDKLSE